VSTELVKGTDISFPRLLDLLYFPFACPIRDTPATWGASLRFCSIDKEFGQIVVLEAIVFIAEKIASYRVHSVDQLIVM